MDKYYLITGNNTEASGSSYLSYGQVLGSTGVVATLIQKNNISFAIPRVNWVKGKSFDSYTEENNAGSYAVYNENVYLCLSNNPYNITNVINSSNYPPTHTIGEEQKPDGYRWKFLYKITSTVSSLSNPNFIPAPSSYGLKALVVNQEKDNVDCTGNTAGTCAQYKTQTGGTYAQLIYTVTLDDCCVLCAQIAEETTKTDLLWTKFYKQGDDVPQTISLFNYTESLENAINNRKINSKLNFEAKTYIDALASGISSGAILSTNINIPAITALEISNGVSAGTYLTVTSAERIITINGGTGGGGTGASAEFIITNNKISGIRLLTHGGEYTPEKVNITLNGISSATKKSALISNITLVGSPPSLDFHKINSIFDVASHNSIGEDRVVNIINAKPDAFTTANWYAIVKSDIEKNTISEIIPAKLPIFPFTSSGTTSNKEIKNINFIQSINNTEKQRR